MLPVSVVLPVFNAEKTIVRAVQSILNQTWTDLELIVVNDGSTDGTPNQLELIRDRRLRVLTTENQGVAKSANFGLKHCQGQLVARMDADDVSHPQRVEKQLAWIQQNELDVIGSQVRILNAEGRQVESMLRYQDWINRETLESDSITGMRFVELPLVNPTVMAQRRFFELGYCDDDLPEDYDLFLRACELDFRFGKVPEPLLDWYEMEEGLTRSDSRYSNEAFDRCRKKHLLRGPLKNQASVDLWGAGQTGKPWLKWLLANGFEVRRLIDVGPRKIGQQIHGCVVVEPESIKQVDHTPIAIAVGREGARAQILEFLMKRGYVAGENAWFVA